MIHVLIAAAAIVALLLWASPGRPHDPFSDWRTHGGGSCCNRGDCVAVPHR